MRSVQNRLLALTVAAALALGMAPVQGVSAAQETKTVESGDALTYERIDIRTADEFAEFASKCYVDSWSENKYISLKADIDLTGGQICVVPVFNGIFDGVGHTISGFDYTGDGYVGGLFRYVERQGVIQNLNLKGNVASTNQKECVGSFCGVNRGTIKNCTFQGTVSGRDTVGGIAGVNSADGTITGCSVKGRITGYYATGGIAGINHGTLNYCSNRAGINDDSAWVEQDDEMGSGMGILESLTDEGESERYSGVDTGGIAGFSDGEITRCTNAGTVGYEHTGYNIGGIAGRQSGIVSQCTNSGTVYGRKDVGGIVGQMEPFIEINEAESLKAAVDKLHDLIDKTINDMQAAKDGVKRDFDVLTSYSDGAVDAADALAEQLGRFADDNLDQAQAMTDRFDRVMEMTPDAMNNFEAAQNSFDSAVDALKGIADDVTKFTDIGDEPYDVSDSRRLSLCHTVGGYVTADSYSPKAGETVTVTAKPDDSQGDYQFLGMEVVKVTDGEKIASLTSETDSFTMPAENVRIEAYFGPGNGIAVPGQSSPSSIRITSNLSGSAVCLINGSKDRATITAEPSGGYTVDYVTLDGERIAPERGNSYAFAPEGGREHSVYIAFRRITTKSGAVENAKTEIDNAVRAARDAAEKIKDNLASNNTIDAAELQKMLSAVTTVMEHTRILADICGSQAESALEAVNRDLENAADHLRSALNSIRNANGHARDIVDYVNGQPDIEFTRLGAEYDYNRINLHNHLEAINNSLRALSDNASSHTDVVNADLKAVNDQINVIFNILTDRLTDAQKLELEAFYTDAGVEDIDAITTGRAESCRNKGVVKGDIHVGGIAGAMSIDDEDRSDSAAGTIEYELGRRFVMKCLVTDSVNEGYITAKKNGAGGICGYMNHGIIVASESYGSIESTEGDYVGGICGESRTVIEDCYALCAVMGNRNVGGIAGYADTLRHCYSMADVRAVNGKAGAIAGVIAGEIAAHDAMEADDGTQKTAEPRVTGNYYVSDRVHGIDNIGYVGVAEPITYEELLSVEQLPEQFSHLKVIYRVDDIYLGSEEVGYGEQLNRLNFPQIPAKEGCYGVWPDVSDCRMGGIFVVQGSYKNNVTVVQSGGNAEAEAAADTVESAGESQWNRPYALIENVFTEEAVLTAKVSDRTPPAQAAKSQCVVYEVTLENGGIGETDTFALRILNPYEEALVYGYREGAWTECASKSRGQYLQVEMTGAQQYFCVVEATSDRGLILFVAAAAAAVIFVLAVLLRKGAARRRLRQQKKEETKEHAASEKES